MRLIQTIPKRGVNVTNEAGDVQEYSEYFTGNLALVLAVRRGGREIVIRFRRGNESVLFSDEPKQIKRGDVIVVRNEDWFIVPKRAWTEEPFVCIVREVRPDELIVEIGSSIRTIKYTGKTEVNRGNTLEYWEISEKLRIISERPIRGLDFRNEDEDFASEFEVDLAEKGLNLGMFGGYKQVVDRALELIQMQLDQRQAILAIGARPIRGVMFTGPPGTGKTLLAQIIAAQSGAKFFVISGPQVVSKWVGSSEGSLRRIFEAAEEAEKAIIFFDEIDSVASRRSEDSHESSNRLVAQLLTLMDGTNNGKGNVVVVAATNRIDEIDPALRRPGRFDWEIEFGVPDLEDRIEILRSTGSRLTVEGDMPLELVADQTRGWSGAELASTWTEAMMLTLRRGGTSITEEDFVEGYERAAEGRQRKIEAGSQQK